MKSKNIITVLVLLFWVFCCIRAGADKNSGWYLNRVKAGNATELAKYMNSTVELLLLDKEDFYKKCSGIDTAGFLERKDQRF